MPRRRWPPIIKALAEDVVKAARLRGLHGKLVLSTQPDGAIVVSVVIPMGEIGPTLRAKMPERLG